MPATVAFFLGSGCSFPSGQPGVAALTDALFSEDVFLMEAPDPMSGFLLGLEGSYPRWGTKSDFGQEAQSFGEESLLPWRGPAASVQQFLRYLMDISEWPRPPNYEDLCGLLRVVGGAIYKGTNDPLVHAFFARHDLARRLAELKFPEGHRYHDDDIAGQLATVEDFVGWCIARHLLLEPELRGYEALSHTLHALRARRSRFHFVTTNYDCNIERLLAREGIPFHDGLIGKRAVDMSNGAWRCGNAFRFFRSRSPAVVKLHGSINLYACHDVNGSGNAMFAITEQALTPAEAFTRYIDVPGAGRMTPKGAPEMLRGSLSKAHEYSYDAYSQLLVGFEAVLERADVLVISGFGWADEAIAARLIRYAYEPDKALLILDGAAPEPAVVRTGWVSRHRAGKPGEGKSVSIHREHLSAMNPTSLIGIIDDCCAV